MDSDNSKKTILVAEDEEMLLETLTMMLEEEGFSVIKTMDGEETEKKALEEKPDLLLLDIQMPRKTGLEALEVIRKDEWGSKVPVVLLTNMGDVRNVAGAVSLEAYDYLIKADMGLEEVISLIKKKLM